MKKQQFDAKGMACPMPVIQTKKLLQQFDVVETIVDNEIATQNLEKLAVQSGYSFSVEKISNTEYITTIGKKEVGVSEEITVINVCDGGTCAAPVKRAKRTLEDEKKVAVMVNDKKNLDDLENFAKKNSYDYTIETLDNDSFKVIIERGELEQQNKVQIQDDSYIVVVNKKIMGHGSEELGKKLIKGFFYALSEQEVLPEKILFYNDGANLVDKERSHVLAELKTLEENGVEILCCGACVDYHNIDLAVGNPTNMYFMVEDMRKANRVVRP